MLQLIALSYEVSKYFVSDFALSTRGLVDVFHFDEVKITAFRLISLLRLPPFSHSTGARSTGLPVCIH